MKRSIIIIVCVFLLSASLWGQEVEYVGSTLWAGVDDLEIVGSYAFCAFSNGLIVMDLTDHSEPTAIGQLLLQHPDFRTRTIKIQDEYAYISDGEKSLLIVCISDVEAPFQVGICETPNNILDFEVSRDYVFAADASSGLRVIDISVPSDPFIAAELAIGFSYSIAIEGEYAIITNGFSSPGKFQIVDISDPTSPILIGTEELLYQSVVDIAAFANYVYVACYGEGIRIYDISDPITPEFVGSFSELDYTEKIVILDSLAFVLSEGYEEYRVLSIVNISNPADPYLIGNCSAGPEANNLRIIEHYVYIANRSSYGRSAIKIIDVSDPSDPELAGEYEASHYSYKVFVSDGFAYVSDVYIGSKIVDVSDPVRPCHLSTFNLGHATPTSFVDGDYAYVSNTAQGLAILDVSDHEEPVLVGNYDTDFFMGLSVLYPYAYLGGYYDFEVVNISDPTDPQLIGSTQIPSSDCDVFVEGYYAYVATFTSGLQIINISNPSDPIIIAGFSTPSTPEGVYVSGSYCYLVCRDAGSLLAVNISDPYHPSLVGTYDNLDNPADVFVQNDIAYIADGAAGVKILDVSDATDIIQLGSYDTPYAAAGIFVEDDIIYVSDRASLILLRFAMTGAIEEISRIPNQFSLSQNHPNPFNASTTIRYDLPLAADVRLEIYDILGRRVETLIDGWQPAGSHSIVWDAEDVSSGVYFYRIEAGEYVQSKSCLLLK